MKPVVVGIITKDACILIGKVAKQNRDEFGGLQYIFPGGKIEDGKTGFDAVARELEEETGFSVRPIKLIGERVHPITRTPIKYFHCKVQNGKPNVGNVLNTDIEELIWISVYDIDKKIPSIHPDVRDYLKELDSRNAL